MINLITFSQYCIMPYNQKTPQYIARNLTYGHSQAYSHSTKPGSNQKQIKQLQQIDNTHKSTHISKGALHTGYSTNNIQVKFGNIFVYITMYHINTEIMGQILLCYEVAQLHLSQKLNIQIFLLSTDRLIDLYTSIIGFNTRLNIKSEICQTLHYETYRSLSVIQQ